MKIAIVEKQRSRTNWKLYFPFEADIYQLTSLPSIKRLLKADIDIDINVEDYDYIITIGADATKYFNKTASVTTHQGTLIDGKYLPLINPNMAKIKPEVEPAMKRAIKDIIDIVEGNVVDRSTLTIHKISDTAEAASFLTKCLDADIVAVDTETTAFYCRKGRVLGISLSIDVNEGAYIDSSCIDDECERLLQLISEKRCVFHGSKFDKHFLKYDFNLEFNNFDDTMLEHYTLDENNEHGLKPLAIKYTDLGEYDRTLAIFKKDYCKKHGIKVGDFTYDLIPFDVLAEYATIDTIATLRLHLKFIPQIRKNERLSKLYDILLIDGTEFLTDMEDNGIPINKVYLEELKVVLADEILAMEESLYKFDIIHKFEQDKKIKFNANSSQQVVELLYDYLDLPIYDKRTAPGSDTYSMDKKVLTNLADLHEIPRIILSIKKNKKIKSTYVDKIYLNLDKDNRLRTGFGLHTTTSGRLSSSGTLNAQTMPRDDKRVKKAIAARPGYKIVSQDLKTAEVFIIACLAKDFKLLDTFKRGEDFHCFIAKMENSLTCGVNEVKHLYPAMRQDAKSFTFKVLYALNLKHPVLKVFPVLKQYLMDMEASIKAHGCCYLASWRKRRLPNVFSTDRGLSQHYVRSGVNALVQGPASDINLKAAIELNKWIKEKGYQDLAKIFMLVHDSIVAEVHVSIIDEYTYMAQYYTQQDWFDFIPDGYKIGVDVEIGDTYAM